MKNRILSITVIVLSTLIFSCNNPSKNQIQSVTVRQEWFPNANYAGELIASKEFAKSENIEIKIEAGSDNIDPIKLVLSGKNDFGVVGADKVLMANESGANLVVIGVINYNSPTCFLALDNKQIKTPKDFEGKTVGVLTGTATEYVYRALLSKAGIDSKKLKEVEAPFDLATFIAGSYDVRPAFIYDEPVSLDMQNLKYNIINPSEYGVSFIGTVYFTTKKMVDEDPETVQSFINAVAKGWEKSIKQPAVAIKYLKEYDSNIDENRELKSLEKGLSFFTGYNNEVLTADLPHWEQMSNTLVELGLLKKSDLKNVVDTSFVTKYHQIKKNGKE
ncbi:MAG: ABC transporter substrate-binding protein [Bacteroidales bacterium]|nr:ABC transporter substrate-binding protein [Bacteroidales bacterium]